MSTPDTPTLTLELGNDVEEARCACCGRITRRITGFVYANGDARAAYISCWTDRHRDLGAEMVISIGEWDGEPPEQRVAIALEWHVIPSGPGYVVLEGPQSKWQGRTVLGRLLARDEALNSEVAEEVFRITNLIYEQDPRFRAFWESTIQ
jgi:hypothetical protein